MVGGPSPLPSLAAMLFSLIQFHPRRCAVDPSPSSVRLPPRRRSSPPSRHDHPNLAVADPPAASSVVPTSSLTPSVFSSGGGRYRSPSSDFRRRGSRDTCVRKYRSRPKRRRRRREKYSTCRRRVRERSSARNRRRSRR